MTYKHFSFKAADGSSYEYLNDKDLMNSLIKAGRLVPDKYYNIGEVAELLNDTFLNAMPNKQKYRFIAAKTIDEWAEKWGLEKAFEWRNK